MLQNITPAVPIRTCSHILSFIRNFGQELCLKALNLLMHNVRKWPNRL